MDKFKKSTPFIEPFTPDNDWTAVSFWLYMFKGILTHVCVLTVSMRC